MSKQLDYKLLQALSAVIREQSFERAAMSIHVTQSAISQRIKLLEQAVSQPVLIRTSPLQLTDVGKKLANHYAQVEQLETELKKEVFLGTSDKPTAVRVATNADSLATWLIPTLVETISQNFVEVSFVVSDEQYSVEKIKSGEVFGAISLDRNAMNGCQSTYLGDLEYKLVCSPKFKEQYFKNGMTEAALKKAPGVAFDQRDDMHINFIKDNYGLKRGDYPLHTVSSSEAFVMLAKHSVAFCFIAELQIREQLASGELVDLIPELKLLRPLYWHRWLLLKGVHQKISNAIIKGGESLLAQNSSQPEDD